MDGKNKTRVMESRVRCRTCQCRMMEEATRLRCPRCSRLLVVTESRSKAKSEIDEIRRLVGQTE